MALERRDTFKLAGAMVATVAFPTLAKSKHQENNESKTSQIEQNLTKSSKTEPSKTNTKSVVVIGGGFGGLMIAKTLKLKDPTLEVTVIEKKDIFISCPFSNAMLGELDGITFEIFIRDFYQPALKYGYQFVHATVTQIDRKQKKVTTTNGVFEYDILVLSPGIVYDYEKQFPKWSATKIATIAQACPAAMMPGNEHIALKREIDMIQSGNIVIVPPASGKYRCPSSPFERASMLANYIVQEELNAKVIILDTRDGQFSEGMAFRESWSDIYGDVIEYKGNTEIIDIDTANKIITYREGQKAESLNYQVCNFMPLQKASPILKMAEIATDEAGYAVMDGVSFRSKTEKTIYIIGDAVGHKIPPSAQTAIWSAYRAADEIIAQLHNKPFDSKQGLPSKSANVCFSLIVGQPHEEAIMATHTFDIDENGNLKGVGNIPIPVDGNGKFRSQKTATATREWFDATMRELFA